VLWFEMDDDQPLPPERWREWCLASVTTHDLPPAACFVNGDHVRLRHRLGLLTGTLDDELAQEEKTLARWVDRLRESHCVGADPDLPEIVEGLYRYLTLTPCKLINVALSDAVGDRHTQNLPGTTDAYPNWRYQIAGPDGTPMFMEDVLASPAVARLADAVGGALRPAGDTRSAVSNTTREDR
jgi:4-alpha-glucanotransferase